MSLYLHFPCKSFQSVHQMMNPTNSFPSGWRETSVSCAFPAGRVCLCLRGCGCECEREIVCSVVCVVPVLLFWREINDGLSTAGWSDVTAAHFIHPDGEAAQELRRLSSHSDSRLPFIGLWDQKLHLRRHGSPSCAALAPRRESSRSQEEREPWSRNQRI